MVQAARPRAAWPMPMIYAQSPVCLCPLSQNLDKIVDQQRYGGCPIQMESNKRRKATQFDA